ncbi:Sec1-like protein [Dillenia turbinata]|uniref:Sec1-like protein n=1 Tax=Dillenia turbinata TaxID=194707 RepID=A0AAN8UIH0_9MAGN
MATIDVIISCLDSIRQISDHIKGATLYLDFGCTESFQFVGAFPLLLELGVCSVCSLESMSPLDVVVDWIPNTNPLRKIVVITSRLLSDAHRYILRCVSTHQGVRQCLIFTSISETAHSAYPDSPLGPDAFREYESLLIQDYEEHLRKREIKNRQSESRNLSKEGDGCLEFEANEEETLHHEAGSNPIEFYEGQKLTVSVHHFPMIFCPFSPKVFVLPSEGSVAEAYLSAGHEDSLSPGLPALSTGLASDGDDTLPGATLTANFLYHFASKMDLKLEIFSFGNLSKAVGKIMTGMSSLYDVGRRKRSAGLLLIDRTLDLLTPCCHGDSLVDRMFSSLPRRERTTSSMNTKGSETQLKHGPACIHRAPIDVKIPLMNLLKEEALTKLELKRSIEAFLRGLGGCDSNDLTSAFKDFVIRSKNIEEEKSSNFMAELYNGSFVSSECFRGTPYLEALLDRRTKDGMVLVKKWLQEIIRREKITVNIRSRPGFASKSELQHMVKELAKNQSSLIRNKGIIQLAAAAVHALEESYSEKWDAFISAEKILSVSAGDTSQSLAAQIGDLINKSALLRSQSQKDGNRGPQRLLSFEDALLLTITGYILAGENFPTSGSSTPFSWQEEQFMKDAIVDAVLENPSLANLKFLQGLKEDLEANLNKAQSDKTNDKSSNHELYDFDDDQWGSWGDEDAADNSTDEVYGDMQLKLELRDRVDNLFKLLHKLSSLKSRNVQLQEGPFAMENNLGGDFSMNKGLLYKILTKVLNKYDIPGLEYHSSTVGRLFKSGFGRLGLGQARPNIGDQSVILVFVIGGINGLEVQEALEALSESGRPDTELLIGGTTLLTPGDMLDLLLGNSSYI